MNGEIGIYGMGNDVSVEVYCDTNVEIRIGECPLIIMSQQQARNLAKALGAVFPTKAYVPGKGWVTEMNGGLK